MSNIRNIILVIATVLIVMIFVDLVFNFSGLLMTNYESFTNLQDIKSIISKKDGKILNVKIISSDIVILPSPTQYNKNIKVGNDGILEEITADDTDIKQQWDLVKVETKGQYEQLLNNTRGLDPNSMCVKYPFYILKSKSNSHCLQYDTGRLTAAPIGNYDSQKWDVSNNLKTGKGICTHYTGKNDEGLDELRQSSETNSIDPNKIKLNLNINDETLKQLFGSAAINNTSETQSQQCDRHIPKDSICSLCPGCCNL